MLELVAQHQCAQLPFQAWIFLNLERLSSIQAKPKYKNYSNQDLNLNKEAASALSQ